MITLVGPKCVKAAPQLAINIPMYVLKKQEIHSDKVDSKRVKSSINMKRKMSLLSNALNTQTGNYKMPTSNMLNSIAENNSSGEASL